MGLLIQNIDEVTKTKYKCKTATLVSQINNGLLPKYYRIPNNPSSIAAHFWSNLLLIEPCADKHTFIVTTIPDGKEEIVRSRFSNHPCGDISDWTRYETIGEPNKRVDIFFYNQNDSDDYSTPVETHIINNRHLYDDNDVQQLCVALSNHFKNGIFVNPFIRQDTKITENKQNRKKII